MFTTEELNTFKSELEGGKTLQTLASEQGKRVPRIRRALIDEFGLDTMRPIFQDARFNALSDEDLDAQISRVSATLARLNAIKTAREG